MRLGRIAILTLISTALFAGQLPAAGPAWARRNAVRDQAAEPTVAAPQDLLAPDDDTSQEQGPSQQVPAESTPVHGEELESKDFATDFVLACAERADIRIASTEVHSQSELVHTSELTSHGLHRLQI